MEGFEHIIVDGWNAIHAHARLAKLLAQQSAEAAQAELMRILSPVHDFDGARLTFVYDGRGDEISIVRKGKILTLSEVYTPSFMTADELIEQLCATSKKPSEILVVTRDNLLRLTATSFGAFAAVPEKFFDRAEVSAANVKNFTSAKVRENAAEWKKSNPFAKLDALALDIESAVRTPLMSKKFKKKLKKIGRAEGGDSADNGKPRASKPSSAAANPQLSAKSFKIGAKPATVKSLEELKLAFERKTAKAQPRKSGRK